MQKRIHCRGKWQETAWTAAGGLRIGRRASLRTVGLTKVAQQRRTMSHWLRALTVKQSLSSNTFCHTQCNTFWMEQDTVREHFLDGTTARLLGRIWEEGSVQAYRPFLAEKVPKYSFPLLCVLYLLNVKLPSSIQWNKLSR